MCEKNDFFDELKKNCLENYDSILKEYKEIIEKIDKEVLEKHEDEITKYKERIMICRTILKKKGPFPNRYLDLVKIGDEK